MPDTESRVPLLRSPDVDRDPVEQIGRPGSVESDDDIPSPSGDDGPGGVQQADAINLVWSRTALLLAYLFIFLCSFAQALQWQILSNLTPYITSEFSSHSLIPTIEIVSSILSGVLKLPISTFIDGWGRPQGLAVMVVVSATGLTLLAASQNIQTYAAARVFYAVGTSGCSYVLNIIVADTSSLQNRTLAFAFQNAPNLFTVFLGPPIARAFYDSGRWRVGFSLFSALFVILTIPILVVLLLNARRAVKLGVLTNKATREGWSLRRIRRDLWEYDAIGVSLVTFGLVFSLVPVSLGLGSANAMNIAFLAVGLVLITAFIVHEKMFAVRTVIAARLLFSRNVAGSCLLFIFIFVSYFSWDSYYTSYLQVVHGLTITEAGYIDHIYGFGSTIWAVVVGYLIKTSDRYKWIAWIALPIHIVGGVALILCRRPNVHVGLLIFAQILLTVGGSTLIICGQMAAMAACTHQDLAPVMAVLSLASYVGSAAGNSLSGAIWNSTLPTVLAERLPDLSPAELKELCSDLTKQLSYPMGSATRDAIIAAYSTAQLKMCLAGTLISLLLVVSVAMWRDAKVSAIKQVKGNVV
ncbi:MFS general substrate transporter [Xylariales sp. PMI_506]|nr:MFS general substrate transporter [Xylariales sp. PMI_506]